MENLRFAFFFNFVSLFNKLSKNVCSFLLDLKLGITACNKRFNKIIIHLSHGHLLDIGCVNVTMEIKEVKNKGQDSRGQGGRLKGTRVSFDRLGTMFQVQDARHKGTTMAYRGNY